MPIVKTAQALRQLAPGDLIEVLATDPGSVKDFAAWSKMTGNDLVETSQEGTVFRFLLKKKG
jgi:tRNA 2-thiouridine synthesizing protein A